MIATRHISTLVIVLLFQPKQIESGRFCRTEAELSGNAVKLAESTQKASIIKYQSRHAIYIHGKRPEIL
jgi:hypothetical protein